VSTTIYLDVDGVINAVSVNSPSMHLTGWTTWEAKPANGWQILYSPEVVEAFNTLAARDDVTVKWLTTWEDDAPQELCPALGINGQDWEVLHGDQHAWRGSDWWKLHAIQADVAATMPDRFVWIDDDIRPEREATDWMATLQHGLWISPNTNWGVTRKHLEAVTAFINRASEVAA
jgi:hypothetical protein